MRKCIYPPCGAELVSGQIGPYCCQEHRFLDAQPRLQEISNEKPIVVTGNGAWGKFPKRRSTRQRLH